MAGISRRSACFFRPAPLAFQVNCCVKRRWRTERPVHFGSLKPEGVSAAIDEAINAFLESINNFQQTYARLRSWRLSVAKAHHLAVELARAGAFASSDILPIVNEFESPRHAEFKERNAWALYNAVTENAKRQSPARQVEGFKALNSILLPALN